MPERQVIMENYIATAIYQNRSGEICALVEEHFSGECIYRLIENIERISYAPQDIAEEAERGFDGFSAFDPYKYGGYSFGEIAEEITCGGDYRLIAEFSDNVAEFIPDNMNAAAVKLFAPLMNDYYEKNRDNSAHTEQLCFFAA